MHIEAITETRSVLPFRLRNNAGGMSRLKAGIKRRGFDSKNPEEPRARMITIPEYTWTGRGVPC